MMTEHLRRSLLIRVYSCPFVIKLPAVIIFLALSIPLLLVAPRALALDTPPLTLPEAYELALAQSETLQIGEAEIRAAEALYRRTAGGVWPELSADASAALRDGSTGSDRATEVYSVGVGGRWVVFNGFRTLREAEARKADGKALTFDLQRTRQLLYEDVADVFYQVLAYQAELRALGDQATALTDQSEALEERVKLGRSRRAEMLSAQAQLAEVLVTAEQVKALEGAALELLAFLVGKDATELNPVDSTPLPDSEDIDRYLAMTKDRPDVAAATARIESSELDLAAAKGNRNVQVTVDGNAYLWRDPEDEGDWDLTVQASLPFFDHGVRLAQEAERAEQVRVSELRLAQLQRITDRDVRLAYRVLVGTLAQWSALQDAIRITTENHETQVRDYELGRSSNIDVIAALVQLHNLRRRSASLEMQAKARLVQLHVAAGTQAP